MQTGCWVSVLRVQTQILHRSGWLMMQTPFPKLNFSDKNVVTKLSAMMVRAVDLQELLLLQVVVLPNLEEEETAEKDEERGGGSKGPKTQG